MQYSVECISLWLNHLQALCGRSSGQCATERGPVVCLHAIHRRAGQQEAKTGLEGVDAHGSSPRWGADKAATPD